MVNNRALVGIGWMQNVFALNALGSSLSSSNQRVSQAARNAFLKNYYTQSFVSAGLKWLCLASVCIVLPGSILKYCWTGSARDLKWCAFPIVTSLFWLTREGDPDRLAQAAFEAIYAGEEDKAIELIQKGANLDWRNWDAMYYISRFDDPPNLLETAIYHSRHQTISFLIDLGINWNDKKVFDQNVFKKVENPDTIKLCFEGGLLIPTCYIFDKVLALDTIKLFVENGMPINLPKSREGLELSPLIECYNSLWRECSRVELDLGRVANRCKIIQFLLEKGAHLSPREQASSYVRYLREMIENIRGLVVEDREQILKITNDAKRMRKFP